MSLAVGYVCSLLLGLMGAWGLRIWLRGRTAPGVWERVAKPLVQAGYFSSVGAHLFMKRLWVASTGLVLQAVATTLYLVTKLGVNMGGPRGVSVPFYLLMAASALMGLGTVGPMLEGVLRRKRD